MGATVIHYFFFFTSNKIKLNYFSSIFKFFKHRSAVVNYILIYSTYSMYSILIISLLYHIKSDVIVLETTKMMFRV